VAVYRLLEQKGGVKMLDDPLIYTATQEILPDPNKSRAQVSDEEVVDLCWPFMVKRKADRLLSPFRRYNRRLRGKKGRWSYWQIDMPPVC